MPSTLPWDHGNNLGRGPPDGCGLADLGITANMVYPPVTDTGWVTDSVPEVVRNSHDHVPVAQPEEVAEVVVYLCSDSARLITGNIIYLR